MSLTNNPNRTTGAGGDLLGRVKRAHDERLESDPGIDSGGEPREASVEGPGAEQFEGAEARAKAGTGGPLERRMVECARAVLDSRFESSEGVREAVVEAVVEARYGALVSGKDREQMLETVHRMLDDDPSFRAELETMLIHAARELGRAAGG